MGVKPGGAEGENYTLVSAGPAPKHASSNEVHS